MLKCIIFDLLGVLYPDETLEAYNLIKELRRLEYDIAAITNLNKKVAQEISASLGISNIYICEELKMSKREPEIYQKFFADHKLSPRECLFVDDHEHNLEAPKKLGLVTVLFAGESLGTADYVAKDLRELLTIIKNHNG